MSKVQDTLSKVFILFSAILSWFDVYSDYAIIIQYRARDIYWFYISLTIVIFAGVAIAMYLFRSKTSRMKFNRQDFTYPLCVLLSPVHGHWLVLILFHFHGDAWKEMAEWFTGAMFFQVVLESIPQLLLQTYVVLRDDDGMGTYNLQYYSIAFSLFMAGKSLLFISYLSMLKSPEDTKKDATSEEHPFWVYLLGKIDKHVPFWGYLFGTTFSFGSLISRSIILVMLAIQYQDDNYVFYALGGMIVARFVLLMTPRSCKESAAPESLSWQLLTNLFSAVGNCFSDPIVNLPVELLSTAEIGAVAYFTLRENGRLPPNGLYLVPLQIALGAATGARIFSGFVFRFLRHRRLGRIDQEKLHRQQEESP